MTLQQCRYIVEIDRHKSISKAAESLFVTQPSISKAVKDVEDEFGITVFKRTNRGVCFTKEGNELLFYAKALLEQEQSAEYHFKGRKRNDMIKLGISNQHYSFAVEALAKTIDYFGEKYQYEILFNEGRATDVIEDVAGGKCDVGILSVSRLNREILERYFISRSLSFTPLLLMGEYVFLRKEHPLAAKESISVSELKDYPYLTYRADDIPLDIAEEFINVNTASKIVYIKDRGTMNNLLSNTNGYNLGTGCIVKNYMNPNIISVPLLDGNRIQVGFIKRFDKLLNKETETYMDYLTQCLKKSAPENSNKQ